MEKSKLIRNILSIASLLICSTLLIVSMFAWYVTNKVANVEKGLGVVSGDDKIHYTDNVIAKKYSVDGTITKNTYSTTTGTLVLIKSEVYTVVDVDSTSFTTDGTLYKLVDDEMESITSGSYDSNTKYYVFTLEQIKDTSFKFLYMLPKEKIDITVGYYMDSDCDNTNYFLKLFGLTGGEFMVDGKTHYSTGAFKYKTVSLVDKSGNPVSNFTPDSDYTFLTHYDLASDDIQSSEKKLYSHVWDNDYEELYFTFSLAEDFSQYYDLVSHASETVVGKLLSNLRFNIGSIYLQLS